ncbi:MAG: glycosyltransferase family 2 protein [candidate division NC10 bacterium]|nr:glycosyltransferase family 2 protein [candidate division NC10 bacterium]
MGNVSVVICCANVADTLEAACRSVSWADELVVVDSGSSDATADIARRFATRYVLEPWRGYTEQKRFGTSLCRHEWILVLDGDEECSPELAREISRLTAESLEAHDVFLMRRRNYQMGRYVRAWSPDWQSRLIHRERCRWADEALDDRRLPSHPSRVARLRGWLAHKRCSQAGFADYFDGKLADARLRLIAEQMYARGRGCGWLDLLVRPALAFVKFYFLKFGFLDGLFGLLIAQKAAMAVQLKYAALWAMQKGRLKPADDPTVR